MSQRRAALFQGRHFPDEIIAVCVRWYLRYSLSDRDLEEIMAERNLAVDHTTVWHWVQRCAPELHRRLRRELKRTGGSWRVDETYVCVAGRWTYLYRAVDSRGATIDFYLAEQRDAAAVRLFFRKALAASYHPRPRVINVDGNPSYPKVVARNCGGSIDWAAVAGAAPVLICIMSSSKITVRWVVLQIGTRQRESIGSPGRYIVAKRL
jgi:transposase-like protein